MATTNHNDVVITGDQDVVQLQIKANPSGSGGQTNPLQTWENDAGTALAQVTEDGRLEVGDTALMTTDESLIEGHSEGTASSDIQRGMNLYGKFTGAISNGIAWLMSELDLPGSGTISGIHAALRSKLTHDNDTNDSSAADLRAGEFEAVNQGGSSGTPVGNMTGVHARVDNQASAYLNNARAVAAQIANGSGADIETAVGLEVLPTENPSGTIDTLIGLDIADMDDGTDNYAIRTGSGKVKLGSVTTGLLKSVNGVVQNIDDEDDSDAVMTGATDTVDGKNGLVPQPLAGDENKFLRGDKTWANPPGVGGGASDSHNILGIEFTNPNLKTWTALNQGTGNTFLEDAAYKRLFMTATPDATRRLRGWHTTAPTPPYTIDIYGEFFATPSTSGLSVGWRQSSTGKLATFDFQCVITSVDRLRMQSAIYNGPNSFNSGYVADYPGNTLNWVRLEDDNTNRNIYLSIDGIQWVLFHSVSRTHFLTSDQIFIGMHLANTAQVNPMVAYYHYQEN